MDNKQLYNVALSDKQVTDYEFLGVLSLDTLPVATLTLLAYTFIVNKANRTSNDECKDVCQDCC